MTVEGGSNKVLIVEDDPRLIELYQMTFIMQPSFEAIIKPTPSEGLTYFAANKDTTHLVILDRDLPEMLGEVVAERIRAISGSPDDPYILMISGRAASLDITALRSRGVNNLLAKPFSPKAVIEELTQANQRFQTPDP